MISDKKLPADILKFIVLFAAIILFFLTKYANLNAVWLLVVFVIPILLYIIFYNIKSLKNKQFSTFLGTYPISKLTGIDAQIAASILIMDSIMILIPIILYLLNRELFDKIIKIVFYQNNFLVVASLLLFLSAIYGYLIIFRNKNR